MTQLFAASERSSSACILGSATMTMVPSSVDINCMPVIAMIAIPSTDDDSGCGEGGVVRSVEPPEPAAADMDSHPTHTGDFGVISSAQRNRSRRNRSLELSGVD